MNHLSPEGLRNLTGKECEQSSYLEVGEALLNSGWTACGAGDWAIALRSPDGNFAARISPFDPMGPFTAAFYREASRTRQVPTLYAHRRLAGGGDLQVMEFLHPAPLGVAANFLQSITRNDPDVAVLARILREVHGQAKSGFPWCGPLDDNPHNVMIDSRGRLRLADPYYADGPNLYKAAETTPDVVAATIPRAERRFLMEIPMTYSGGFDPRTKAAILEGLAEADASGICV